MTSAVEVIASTETERWMAVLSETAHYDFYHLPQYHEMAGSAGEGTGRLFAFRQGRHLIAVPILIRACSEVDGLTGSGWFDATSVYGYVGPVSSDPDPPASVIRGFQASLREELQARNVVALFARLHPLMAQSSLIAGLGESTPRGTTVSLDLTEPEEAQLAKYRVNHSRGLKKLRALGATSSYDPDGSLDDFIDIYYQTMHRVSADPRYFFDRDYFAQLGRLRGTSVHLFTCHLGATAVAAGLFLTCRGIAQYHLGATRDGYGELGPLKLVIDSARAWATDRGMQVLHLGGGLGGREDSLFHFKAGFSDRRHPYATWQWVIDQERYDWLSRTKAEWNVSHGLRLSPAEHFPVYRALATSVGTDGAGMSAPSAAVTDNAVGLRRRVASPVAGGDAHEPGKAAGPPNVLITAAGRRTTLVRKFADVVAARGGRTYAGDVDPLAPALFLADEAIQLSPTDDPGYVADLIDIVRRHRIRLVVPTIDPDLPVLAGQRAALKSIGCAAAVSSPSFVTLAFDKFAAFSTIGPRGIAMAATWLPGAEPADLPNRLFIKPRRGSGSASTYVVDREALEHVLPLVEEPIIQEVLDGAEISIDALLDTDGRPIHYVPRRRIRTLAGESIQGVTLEHDPVLERWIANLLEVCGSLGASGPLCLQAFLTDRGPILSEINARFGGGFPLALAAGGDYVSWLLDLADGIHVPSRLGSYEAGLFMTRYNVEQFTRAPKW